MVKMDRGSKNWVKPTVYGVSIVTGVTGAIASGLTGGLLIPVLIGAGTGGAIGWWVNQIIKIRS